MIMGNIKKDTILNVLIFILFAVLTFVVGIHHEPWADEAQAWLIARNCTIPEMILNVLKYEGHPILWFAILRVLNFIHYPYKFFFIVPWIASCIGVYLLIFKSKMPSIIKYLFPFTYFIFYQSAVIGRNHSLFFPILMGIAVIYKDRLRHPYLYSLLLILTASISAYSFVIAFGLLCFFIFDIFKSKRCSIKEFLPALAVLLCMIFTALYLIKPADYNFYPNLNLMRLNPFRVVYITARGYFNIVPLSSVLVCQMIATLLVYIFCAKTFCKTKRQLLFYTMMNLMLAVVVTALVCKPWHVAYFIITLIFICSVLAEENNIRQYPFKSNEVFYIMMLFIFSMHIFWSWECSLFDIQKEYSASRSVAKFIKENNLNSQNIIGFGYKTVAIQPYFNENIYVNYDKESFWKWQKDFYARQKNIQFKNYPVIVIDTAFDDNFTKIIKDLQNDYYSYFFNGCLYEKGHPEEDESYVILVKK